MAYLQVAKQMGMAKQDVVDEKFVRKTKKSYSSVLRWKMSFSKPQYFGQNYGGIFPPRRQNIHPVRSTIASPGSRGPGVRHEPYHMPRPHRSLDMHPANQPSLMPSHTSGATGNQADLQGAVGEAYRIRERRRGKTNKKRKMRKLLQAQRAKLAKLANDPAWVKGYHTSSPATTTSDCIPASAAGLVTVAQPQQRVTVAQPQQQVTVAQPQQQVTVGQTQQQVTVGQPQQQVTVGQPQQQVTVAQPQQQVTVAKPQQQVTVAKPQQQVTVGQTQQQVTVGQPQQQVTVAQPQQQVTVAQPQQQVTVAQPQQQVTVAKPQQQVTVAQPQQQVTVAQPQQQVTVAQPQKQVTVAQPQQQVTVAQPQQQVTVAQPQQQVTVAQPQQQVTVAQPQQQVTVAQPQPIIQQQQQPVVQQIQTQQQQQMGIPQTVIQQQQPPMTVQPQIIQQAPKQQQQQQVTTQLTSNIQPGVQQLPTSIQTGIQQQIPAGIQQIQQQQQQLDPFTLQTVQPGTIQQQVQGAVPEGVSAPTSLGQPASQLQPVQAGTQLQTMTYVQPAQESLVTDVFGEMCDIKPDVDHLNAMIGLEEHPSEVTPVTFVQPNEDDDEDQTFWRAIVQFGLIDEFFCEIKTKLDTLKVDMIKNFVNIDDAKKASLIVHELGMRNKLDLRLGAHKTDKQRLKLEREMEQLKKKLSEYEQKQQILKRKSDRYASLLSKKLKPEDEVGSTFMFETSTGSAMVVSNPEFTNSDSRSRSRPVSPAVDSSSKDVSLIQKQRESLLVSKKRKNDDKSLEGSPASNKSAKLTKSTNETEEIVERRADNL